ncbi:hypothetical protein RhiirA4_448331 [Rhizophagus irregularis]|uniref:Galactose oxidase n=1 Tax=Rhizophagus irregularis TaxID=588596 RepID=A0A2I1H8S3_9GLOM|nr:hypothetical protein RhiirA4_448331 [Rhizophagus irregularis]
MEHGQICTRWLIIIYGGINDIYLDPVPDQISVLDTKVNHFTWFTPNIDSAPSTAPLNGHTATLVGNYDYCICPYTLVGRFGHTASYMDNKIYFLGGITKDNIRGANDFFYLDVSIPFNLDSTLPIVDLSNDAHQVYPHFYGVSTVCGSNKDTIFLIFGVSKENFSSFSYRFINNKEWVQNTFGGIVKWSSAVCNNNGSYIYIYGSYDVNKYMMTIIDTTRWDSASSDLNIPNYLGPPILLPNGRIAYIGERNIHDLLVNLRNIHMYDTNNGTWENMSTSGIEPSPRNYHTTVLTQDGLIIIYGGANNKGAPVTDQISVLDIKVSPFTWSILNDIDPVPRSAPYGGHTATIVGNYMIIAFGFYLNATSLLAVLNDQIHMIDVSEDNNYKFVKSFTPNITKTAYPTETLATIPNITKAASPTKSAIIGGTTGGIATIIIIVSVSYLLYRKKRTVKYAPQAKPAINC